MINSKSDLIKNIEEMSAEEFSVLQKLLNRTGNIAAPVSAPATKNDLDVYTAITEFIVKHGFAANLKGYPYIRTALMIMINEPELYDDAITLLYTIVGERHNTTGSRTERAIRHSITAAYDRHPELFTEFPVSKKAPTNSEFLYAVADIIKRQANIE